MNVFFENINTFLVFALLFQAFIFSIIFLRQRNGHPEKILGFYEFVYFIAYLIVFTYYFKEYQIYIIAYTFLFPLYATLDDDNLIVVMSRKNFLSYNTAMLKIPIYFNKYFQSNSFILIYPTQSISMHEEKVDLTNSSLSETIENVDIIGKTISNIFRKNL